MCIGSDETMVESEIWYGVGLFDLHVSRKAEGWEKNESIERCLHRVNEGIGKVEESLKVERWKY